VDGTWKQGGTLMGATTSSRGRGGGFETL